jgi:hypothetical protein
LFENVNWCWQRSVGMGLGMDRKMMLTWFSEKLDGWG